MNNLDDDEEDDDEEDDFPLLFHEALGDHTLSEDIRGAVVWAAIQRFLSEDEDLLDEVEEEAITDKQKLLAKAIVFRGPLMDFKRAVELAYRRQAVVVAPRHLWTDDSQPVWLAYLAN